MSTTFAMQQQRQMLETASMTASTARAMKEGTTAMKAVQKELNVDQVRPTGTFASPTHFFIQT